MMGLGVNVVRDKNRTAGQFYNQFIQPRERLVLTEYVQKIGVAAKRGHSFQNRTGALEYSIAWEGAEVRGDMLVAAVQAGGPSQAQFAYDASQEMLSGGQAGFRIGGRRRRNLHRDRQKVKRGHRIYVDYAKYVEGYGYTVLTAFVRQFAPMLRAAFGLRLKVERVP